MGWWRVSIMRHFFLFFFSLLSCISFVLLPVATFADGATTGDSVSIGIDFSATSSTGSEAVNNYLWGEFVAEWMDEDDSTFTVYDFTSRLVDAYISYQYAVPSGGVSVLKDAIFDTIRDYTFYVDSQTGFVSAPSEFYHDLEEIYERFGYDSDDPHIGFWYPLPRSISSDGHIRKYDSSSDVYCANYGNKSGIGQSWGIVFAVRGSTTAHVDYYYDGNLSGNGYNVNSHYTQGYYDGYYKTSSTSYEFISYDIRYTDLSSALADFFGDTPESGGTVWNGNLYYDNTPNSFTLNNAKGGTTDASNRYSLLTFLDVQPDDANLHQYFDGDTTIIYNPNFSDIPNTHDFSFELPSGSMPDLDFDFNYTIQEDSGGSFFAAFDGVFGSSGGILVICVTILGVFLLIEVMT